MKLFVKYIIGILFLFPVLLEAQTQVTYKMEYDFGTEKYTVSMKSNTLYNPPLSRISASAQITIVIPQISGGWQPANLSALTALGWGFSYLDGSTLGLSDDYLFFAPTNAGTYSPFQIPLNTYIELFSFESGSGCVGDLSLYHNTNDPLNAHPNINADNNMVILGAGPGNVYVGNDSGSLPCAAPCAANAGTLGY